MTARRTRTAAAVGAAVLALALAPLPAASGRPTTGAGTAGGRALPADVDATLAALPAGRTTTVVLTLRGGLDPNPVATSRQSQRAAAVVATLKEQARVSQGPLLARLAGLAASGGVTDVQPLWVVNEVSVTATADVIRDLAARADVTAVRTDDLDVTPSSTEWNVTASGAPRLWADGADGSGAVVAVLDSGVDTSHADLASGWRGGAGGWFDPFGQHATPADASGHGTGSAGVAVGGDANDGYGVAPGATWIGARVFNDAGAGSVTAMHQVFQWVLDPDGDPATADAPDVVNASWVLGSGPSCDLTLQPDVQALRAAGIVPVFAAGNFGPNGSTSASPANYPESLSVGAVDAVDRVWAYTSSGPSTCGGRTRVFPDVVAPGVGIRTADRYDSFQTLTGTSVAAPHVAGALALLRAAHPDQPADVVESALLSTATDLGASGPDQRYGNGRIDLVAADTALRQAPEPADVALSLSPSTLTVGRGKSGSTTLSVSVISGTPGAMALTTGTLPTGVSVTMSPTSVTAPGAATVTVKADKKKAARGTYTVDLTATSGSLERTVVLTVVVR
jgi:subtilisin family serine protease